MNKSTENQDIFWAKIRKIQNYFFLTKEKLDYSTKKMENQKLILQNDKEKKTDYLCQKRVVVTNKRISLSIWWKVQETYNLVLWRNMRWN